MLHYSATVVLPKIKVPVLAVAGDIDPVTQPDASQQIAQGIPQGKLTYLKPAKHLGLWEHHEEFGRMCQDFFDRIFTQNKESSSAA